MICSLGSPRGSVNAIAGAITTKIVLVEHISMGEGAGDNAVDESISANHASSSADRCKEIALMDCTCTPYFKEIEATSVGMTSKREVRTFMHYVG